MHLQSYASSENQQEWFLITTLLTTLPQVQESNSYWIDKTQTGHFHISLLQVVSCFFFFSCERLTTVVISTATWITVSPQNKQVLPASLYAREKVNTNLEPLRHEHYRGTACSLCCTITLHRVLTWDIACIPRFLVASAKRIISLFWKKVQVLCCQKLLQYLSPAGPKKIQWVLMRNYWPNLRPEFVREIDFFWTNIVLSCPWEETAFQSCTKLRWHLKWLTVN